MLLLLCEGQAADHQKTWSGEEGPLKRMLLYRNIPYHLSLLCTVVRPDHTPNPQRHDSVGV